MIKYTRLFITFLLAVCVLEARSQSTATTSSPYSRYGFGDYIQPTLPQNIGMGGISTATSSLTSYSTINVLNPAAYSKIHLTVIDAGLYTNSLTLRNDTSAKQRNGNTRLSHIAFAFPVSQSSAISFGLLPYSELGYKYKISRPNLGSGLPVDTNTVNYIYSGDGGLSKAYVGYGFSIGKHLSLGANASYIFGSLKEDQSTEIPNAVGFLNSRTEQNNKVGGFNFDYGAQYSIDFSTSKHLVLGYSASIGNKINVQNSYIVSQYYISNGSEGVATDSLVNNNNPKAKLQLPAINHFGIVFQKDLSFLVGVDYSIGKWSDLSIAGTNAGLQDSKMLNVGGQWTPNVNALNNYLALIDYRLGFIYEDTYLNLNNTSIKRQAVTFGLGIPLPHDRASSAFYKVNFSAEIGKRGTVDNGLIKENYVNFHIALTLNDQWFRRFKFD